MIRSVPQIKRVVTVVTEIVEGLVQEAALHDVIVMGTGLRRLTTTAQAEIFLQIVERGNKPIVLVRAAQAESLEFHAPQFFHRSEETPTVRVDRWFAENTFHSSEFSDLRALLALKEKQGFSVSLALPALNEEETVGHVIKTLKTALMDEIPLLDEIVLIDSNSDDKTVAIADAYGIPNYIYQNILRDELGAYTGKGEALCKSLYVTKGDIIA